MNCKKTRLRHRQAQREDSHLQGKERNLRRNRSCQYVILYFQPLPRTVRNNLCCLLPAEWLQLCPTLCDTRDCSPPVSSIHGIFQARVLEWAAISFYWGSSQPRDRTRVSHVADRHFTIWATRMRFGPKRRLSAKKIDAFEPSCCRRLLRVP